VDKPLVVPQGVEVVQDVANGDPRKTKLLVERQSRRGSMDVACLSDTDAYLVAQSGTFEQATVDKISRLNAVYPELKKASTAQVILYNSTKVTAAPEAYADLWDPKWRGRVGFSDILYGANTMAAALAGGGGVNDFGPADKKLMELRSLDAKI
jgi:putative spermidine/putrescine transport system substrate-binding protein